MNDTNFLKLTYLHIMKAVKIFTTIFGITFAICLIKLAIIIVQLSFDPSAPNPNFMTTSFCVLIVWTGIASAIGVFGETRLIGYWPPFWISILFSPVIALIVILFSKRKSTHVYEQNMLKLQQEIASKK